MSKEISRGFSLMNSVLDEKIIAKNTKIFKSKKNPIQLSAPSEISGQNLSLKDFKSGAIIRLKVPNFLQNLDMSYSMKSNSNSFHTLKNRKKKTNQNDSLEYLFECVIEQNICHGY